MIFNQNFLGKNAQRKKFQGNNKIKYHQLYHISLDNFIMDIFI